MELTEAFIGYWARGETASERARALCAAFSSLCRNRASNILEATYPGSAEVPYHVAVDLRNAAAPLFFCDCPSRRRPCKHALGLLWALLLRPERFTLREDRKPDGRENTGRRVSRPLPMALDPDALREARKLLHSLLASGFDAQSPALVTADKRKAQKLPLPPALRAGLLRVYEGLANPREDRAALLERLAALLSLIDRALAASGQRREAPEWVLDTELGRSWRYEDLRTLGFSLPKTRLVQLAFWSEDDIYARRYTDIGLWAEPETAAVRETRSYRPYEALRSLAPEDSVNQLVETDQAVLYPGSGRVRWNACRPLPPEESTLAQLCRNAGGDARPLCAAAAKALGGGARSFFSLLRFRDIGKAGGRRYLRDETGSVLPLSANESSGTLLEAVYHQEHQACLLRFRASPKGATRAEALCLLSETGLRHLI